MSAPVRCEWLADRETLHCRREAIYIVVWPDSSRRRACAEHTGKYLSTGGAVAALEDIPRADTLIARDDALRAARMSKARDRDADGRFSGPRVDVE